MMYFTATTRIILPFILQALITKLEVWSLCEPTWITKPPDPTFALKNTDVKLVWQYNITGCDLLWGKWGTGETSVTKTYFSQDDKAIIKSYNVPSVEFERPATLILKNVTFSAQTTYITELNFNKGNYLKSLVKLRVVGVKPTITNSLPTTEKKREGSGAVTFTVRAESDPVPKIYWRKNDQDIPLNSSYEIQARVLGQTVKNETIVKSTLTIRTIRRDDRAKFTARVAYGTTGPYTETHMDFDVQYPPTTATFYTNLTRATMLEGQSVKFTCESEANPPPTYHFFKDSVLLNTSKSGVLIVSGVSASSAGTYECQPKNIIQDGVRLYLNISVMVSATGKRTGSEDDYQIWLIVLIAASTLLFLMFLVLVIIYCCVKKRYSKKGSIEGQAKTSTNSFKKRHRDSNSSVPDGGFSNPGFYPGSYGEDGKENPGVEKE